MSRPRLFLLDGAAVAYRSYYAFIKNPRLTTKGLNTSAVFGFLTTLLMILEKQKPDYFAVVFDSKEPTFRHKMYKEYKANREEMPDDLAKSFPYIEKMIKALSIPILVKPGYEADDIIGTMVERAKKEKVDSVIVSGDKDFMQLIGPAVKMFKPKWPDDWSMADEKDVMEKFGVKPEQVIDVLALMGDTSDNVPGVPGIGEKTATTLIQEYGSFENLFKNVEKIQKPKLKEALQKNRPLADLSKELVTIHCEVPIKEKAKDLVCEKPDLKNLRELFKELEFTRSSSRVEEYASKFGAVDLVLENPEEPAKKGRKEKGVKKEKTGEAESIEINVKIVSKKYVSLLTEEEIEKALAMAAKAGLVAVDTETTGLDPLTVDIVGVSLAWKEKEGVFIPFNQSLAKERAVKLLKPFLENPKIQKGGQNSKYDWAVFKSHGIEPQGFAFDTMLESFLLDSSYRQHNLDAIALKHFNYTKIPTAALIGSGKKQITMDKVPLEAITQYACEDVDFTLRAHNFFTPKLKKEGLEKLYHEVELPLVLVLEDMERKGICVDVKLLKNLSEDAGEELKKLTKKIYKEAGEEFTIASPLQLGKILFEKMQVQKVSGTRVKKTKTGYATDVDVLESLKGVPIADMVLEYRQLSKLKNTYLDVLPEMVHPKDGRIHTSYSQAVAATGRLSSNDPNLQNIPIRSEFGRKIRGAFIPKDSKHVLISADYSQIELRVLAHITGDPNLIKTFENEEDVHRRTASLIFGVPMDKVTPTQRNQAKTINFGVIYGMGPQRLARENGVSMAEAKKFIEDYFAKYPGIEKFTTECVETAREKGFVKTILGRKRLLPDIQSTNVGLRITAEHMAVNTPIQGSAADLIKVAMVRLHEKLQTKKMETAMLLQVHDELVFEAPRDEVEEAKKIITHEMENAMQLKVPLKVDVGVGKNWLEAH
ncbi:MAG TPA: DNA polymerase I [bacterium]|nr:DNA polymerase I [bacterium]